MREDNTSQVAIYSIKNYHVAHAGILQALKLGGFRPVLLVRDNNKSAQKDGQRVFAVASEHVPAGFFSTAMWRRDPKAYVREVPRLLPLLLLFFRQRPALTLVYERSVRSSVVAFVAFLFRSRVIQVLDSPTLRWSASKKPWALPNLWLRYLLTPKRRIHSGGMGTMHGERVALGPLLGASTFAPYPVRVPERYQQVRTLRLPLRIICVAGSNHRHTNFSFVLSALKDMVQNHSVELTFLVWPSYAETQTREIRSLQKKMSLRQVSIQYGVASSEFQALLLNFDAMIYSSSRGIYGHAVSVALSCGMPVICSRGVGARVLIREGQNGFLFHPHKEKELSRALRSLVQPPSRFEELSREALRLYEENFSLNAWLDAVIEPGFRGESASVCECCISVNSKEN